MAFYLREQHKLEAFEISDLLIYESWSEYFRIASRRNEEYRNWVILINSNRSYDMLVMWQGRERNK